MEEMINAFRAYADVKRISLTYESNFRYMNTWLDKDKMDSILKNLISNALKYTPEGGSVHIYTAETEDHWSVEVKDTGIGIPANRGAKIFERFGKINNFAQGTGLGLTVSRMLVERMGGRIWVRSGEGIGTTFYFTLPMT